MGILAHLSILSLSVLVVCGNPPGLDVPEKSPSVSRQARSVTCENWCQDPDGSGRFLCCEDITEAPPRGRFWSNTVLACIRLHNNIELFDVTFEECKAACIKETRFVCRSVDYWPGGKGSNGQYYPIECDLSTADTTSTDYDQPCYAPYNLKNIYSQLE